MKLRVYVAGPVHGSGTQANNLRRALLVMHALMKRGHHPFVPHLLFAYESAYEVRGQEVMMRYCLEWLAQCHVMVRIDGVSPGADREEAAAKDLGIPVVHVMPEVVDMFAQQVGPSASHCNDMLRDVEESGLAVVSSFGDLQREVVDWLSKQPFGATGGVKPPAIGVVEEVAELREALVQASEVRTGTIARSVLKMEQGIRGTREQHIARIHDAIGDIVVFAAGFCSAAGFSLQGAVNRALYEVKSRDWRRFPNNGKTE